MDILPRAPIFERAIVIEAIIPEDIYQINLLDWNDAISKIYPMATQKCRWDIKVSNKNGIPELDELNTASQIINWNTDVDVSGDKHEWVVQCSQNRLVVNMIRRNDKQSRCFEDLTKQFKAVFDIWCRLFEVKNFYVATRYWNKLNAKRYPEYFKNGNCSIEKILKIFKQELIPEDGEFFVPFDYSANWNITKDEKVFINSTKCKIVEKSSHHHLTVDFSSKAVKAIDHSQLDNIFEIEHKLMHIMFEKFFTEKIMKEFKNASC
jgi:hypothetical protein